MLAFNIAVESGQTKNTTLDALWTLIESYEVDIFEVSLSQITNDFLKMMKEMVLSIVDEANFAEMATRLIYYKSKQMLPTFELVEEDTTDDRLPIELVEQLLEYKKFQMMATELEEVYLRNQLQITRESSWHLYEKQMQTLEVDLFSLLKSYQEFLLKKDKEQPLIYKEEDINAEEVLTNLKKTLTDKKEVSFFHWITGQSILYIVVSFIIILELLRIRLIKLEQSTQNGDIQIIAYDLSC